MNYKNNGHFQQTSKQTKTKTLFIFLFKNIMVSKYILGKLLNSDRKWMDVFNGFHIM